MTAKELNEYCEPRSNCDNCELTNECDLLNDIEFEMEEELNNGAVFPDGYKAEVEKRFADRLKSMEVSNEV